MHMQIQMHMHMSHAHAHVTCPCDMHTPCTISLHGALHMHMHMSLHMRMHMHMHMHDAPARCAAHALRHTDAPLDAVQVRGSAATRQISATYSHSEGAAMQIVLQLSACHPLRALEVEGSP